MKRRMCFAGLVGVGVVLIAPYALAEGAAPSQVNVDESPEQLFDRALKALETGAPSRAIAFVNPKTPPFADEYATDPIEPIRPASDEMFTMRP